MGEKISEIAELLDPLLPKFMNPEFIKNDPIQIPHLFSSKQDIEISGLLSSTIAWGNRKSIITNSKKILELMDNSPYQFIMDHTDKNLKSIPANIHRTFMGTDFISFLKGLKKIYHEHDSLENLFICNDTESNLRKGITKFRNSMISCKGFEERSKKHISNPESGSACKRLNMFLRWMVRPNESGVDFGIWTRINPAKLSIPLDVHSGRIARKLNMLKRKQNDWKAVEELDSILRKLDNQDPVKYDFVLFGIGVEENLKSRK